MYSYSYAHEWVLASLCISEHLSEPSLLAGANITEIPCIGHVQL